MLRLMKEKEEIDVVNDQTGKPTNAKDLADYILKIIVSQDSNYGIRHFTGNEQMTWFKFAKKIAEENGFPTKINPIATSQYPTPAKRPMWSVLGG
jgi:dTDP-4-dehydrorhamnose reductase